ncbi:monocarboxylate transporter 12-like [Lytechinus pictus]|uniref:monocarboxylate transporter 12-like n=1 Tax=Lytechinus pictus TaxID=7653 RepID=UPI0030BA146B
MFPTHASLLDYFSPIYKIATAVTFTAGGVGMMTLPVLAEELRRIYSWRGAMLLLGGISLHCIPCCALFRPKTYQSTPSNADEVVTDLPSIHDGDADESEDDASSTSHLLNSHGTMDMSSSNVIEQHSSFTELFQRHPLYLTTVTSVVITGTSYSTWVIFVIPNAEAKGFPSSDAVFFATIGGAANIIGRFFLGFFSSRKLLEDRMTFCLLHFVTAVVFFLNTVAHSFPALAFLSFASGFLFGGLIVTNACLPQSSVSPDLAVVALSLNYLIGIGEVGGGAIVGILYDKLQSYNFAFIVAGLIDIAAIIIILVPAACQKLYSTFSSANQYTDVNSAIDK